MNKLKKIQVIKKKLANDIPSIGSWIQIPEASSAEILGDAGYDWVAVDLEHGLIGENALPGLFRALELGDTLPLARIAEVSKDNCKKALDAGAGGLIIPMIETAEELNTAINFSCWPPNGERGVGYSRANLFGKRFFNYIKEAQNPFIVAMIENKEALENIDEITKVKGLNAILIGPYDLSASLGNAGNFETKEFLKAQAEILAYSKISKVPCGVHQVAPNKNELKNLIKQGFTFIPYSIDSVFLEYYSKYPL